MTSLGDQAWVGTLHYKNLDPPVSGGGTPNLQQVCSVGASTNTNLFLSSPTAEVIYADNINIVKALADKSVDIGFSTGTSAQRAVNIGTFCGTAGGNNSVNIGENCGVGGTQGDGTIAIGEDAGQTNQQFHSVAIGFQAGNTTQGVDAIAIGTQSGNGLQGTDAIAIGKGAGSVSQGANSICIGEEAGLNNQPANSICLNSSGTTLINPATNSFCVSDIRGATNPAGGPANHLWYDTTTKEIHFHIP